MKRPLRRHPSAGPSRLPFLAAAACLAIILYSSTYTAYTSTAAKTARVSKVSTTTQPARQQINTAPTDYVTTALTGKTTNPFLPIGWKSAAPLQPNKIQAAHQPVLRGIIASGNNLLALIENGSASESYASGDKLDDYVVGSITANSVELTGSKSILLKLE